MSTPPVAVPTGRWRDERRQSARDALVDAAWRVVHAEGLAALSIRGLAKEAGVSSPTIYAYFESKDAIYDAMFGQAATAFAARMTEPYTAADPRALLIEGVNRFVEFCVADTPRYQLLFQRTIPGFEPSPEAFAPAVRALEASRERLAANGVTEDRHVDMWTALTTGLVDQQISNDPGGTRWSSLVEDAVDMCLAYTSARRPSARRATGAKKRSTT